MPAFSGPSLAEKLLKGEKMSLSATMMMNANPGG
jgi:hypothetical protein